MKHLISEAMLQPLSDEKWAADNGSPVYLENNEDKTEEELYDFWADVISKRGLFLNRETSIEDNTNNLMGRRVYRVTARDEKNNEAFDYVVIGVHNV